MFRALNSLVLMFGCFFPSVPIILIEKIVKQVENTFGCVERNNKIEFFIIFREEKVGHS